MAFRDEIKLISCGGLMIAHAPSDKLKMAQISNKLRKQGFRKSTVQSFGLFDTNTANYNTYYPDVTAKDLKPKKDEFIEPVFRALSEVVVHKEYNPIDFGIGSTLRKSMKLLKAQTVNTDHEDAVGNAIGSVSGVFWEEKYKDSNGIWIPAGINSRLKIDGKSHPRVARAIMMDPPAIHSTSVTVNFLWEKSHPEMSDESFWKSLGGFDKEGKLVRRIATEINRYHEISLVSHGADPFAQLIKENGELNNSMYANISYNSVGGKVKQKQKIFAFDFKTDIISNSKNTAIPKELIINQSSQTKKGMKKFLIQLAKKYGFKDFNPEDESQLTKLMAKIEKLKLSDADATELKGFREGKEATEKKLKRYEKLRAENKASLEKFRKQVIKNYGLSVNGKKDQAIVDSLKEADMATLTLFNKEYLKKIEEKYPSTCANCGSSKITKASSVLEDETEDKGELSEEEFDELDTDKAMSFMHGEDESEGKKGKKSKTEE